MFLKRKYDESTGVPIVTHVEVLSAPDIQKITPKFIHEQAAAGILTLADGKITIKTGEGQDDLVYVIKQGPGLYCCFCESPLGDPKEAQKHVAFEHEGDESSDEQNPAGYRKDNFFLCQKEA